MFGKQSLLLRKMNHRTICFFEFILLSPLKLGETKSSSWDSHSTSRVKRRKWHAVIQKNQLMRSAVSLQVSRRDYRSGHRMISLRDTWTAQPNLQPGGKVITSCWGAWSGPLPGSSESEDGGRRRLRTTSGDGDGRTDFAFTSFFSFFSLRLRFSLVERRPSWCDLSGISGEGEGLRAGAARKTGEVLVAGYPISAKALASRLALRRAADCLASSHEMPPRL